ncbi:hypothetical protein ACWD04_09530 [Streptomyces sp. NPDC002911]
MPDRIKAAGYEDSMAGGEGEQHGDKRRSAGRRLQEEDRTGHQLVRHGTEIQKEAVKT